MGVSEGVGNKARCCHTRHENRESVHIGKHGIWGSHRSEAVVVKASEGGLDLENQTQGTMGYILPLEACHLQKLPCPCCLKGIVLQSDHGTPDLEGQQ